MSRSVREAEPESYRILLVESGPRSEAERLVPLLRRMRDSEFGNAQIDLFTCLRDSPPGLGPDSRAWRTFRATTHSERWRMLRALRGERHVVAAVLCGESPILGIWKVVLAVLLPARILLVERGSETCWMAWRNWRRVLRLSVAWCGLAGPELPRRLAEAAFLPVGLCVLLAFAAKVHLRRLMRVARRAHRSDDIP